MASGDARDGGLDGGDAARGPAMRRVALAAAAQALPLALVLRPALNAAALAGGGLAGAAAERSGGWAVLALLGALGLVLLVIGATAAVLAGGRGLTGTLGRRRAAAIVLLAHGMAIAAGLGLGDTPIAALPEGTGLAWMALAATAYLALTTALLRRWPLPLPFARRGG